MILLYKLLIFLLFILSNSYVLAFDSHYCIHAINLYQEKYKIPKNLLHSIAIIESGRWHKEKKDLVPSPWTLNIAGTPYYFDNREEALNFFKKALSEGIENIDVGCAQINWYYHGKHHFKNPESALNPASNIAYAAQLLSKNFLETSDWLKAVGIYHSKNITKGNDYAVKVLTRWKKYNSNNISAFDKIKKKRKSKILFQNDVIPHYSKHEMLVMQKDYRGSNAVIMP